MPLHDDGGQKRKTRYSAVRPNTNVILHGYYDPLISWGADNWLPVSQGALKNWSSIADKLPKRTNKDCRKRWSKVCEPVKKGAWSSVENERLRNAINQHGHQ